MRILLWHGYLLTGSGSNVYTANIARSWRTAGHDVLLLCQEKHAAELDYVDAAGDFVGDNSGFDLKPTSAVASAGTCHVARPAIGDILPLYVYDEYDGVTAKLYVDLDADELDTYVSRNVDALVTAIREHEPHAIITGHEVMGPYIAKLHGSGLEYAVKLQDRYRDYAVEGLGAAACVVGGSNYMVAEAGAHIPGWADRAAVVNPGCDIDIFRPTPREEPPVPNVAYVGKLIASKGVHNLLGALGCTRPRTLEVTVVGYGGFDEGLRSLAGALTSGDKEKAQAISERGESGRLGHLADHLATASETFWQRLREIPVEFTGRLEHGPLSRALPYFDVLVVPSVVPEAFGMVAAEAAACGVLPIVPDHSGIGEAGRAIEDAIGRPGLLTYNPNDPLPGIAARIDALLDLDFAERRELGLRAVDIAR